MNKNLLNILKSEWERQNQTIDLIASENIANYDVLFGCSTIFSNKYAEGYPGKRYYEGCENVDKLENYAIDLVKKIFNAEHANVQPHSGSQANEAVYLALLNPGDKILSMNLYSGGHLSHGASFNISGIIYRAKFYDVDTKTNKLNYKEIRKIAIEYKPKLIICGASSYSNDISWKEFHSIAKECGAILMADIAHISGMIAAKLLPNPFPYTDIVTTTTHKTLNGPRGGLIMCKNKYKTKIDKALFPGIQGGPQMNNIYAKAVCFANCLTSKYISNQKRILEIIQIIIKHLKKYKVKIVSNNSVNHLILINTIKYFGLQGENASKTLAGINLIVNANMLPCDNVDKYQCSGIRMGSVILAKRQLSNKHIKEIIDIMIKALRNSDNSKILAELKKSIKNICDKYPIYSNYIDKMSSLLVNNNN